MNAEVKAKWVAALRSGKYKQGQRALHNRDDDTYCCLGVLCELYKADHPEFPVSVMSPIGRDVKFTAYGASEKYAVLPVEVTAWADVSSCGVYPGSDLVNDNDKLNKSFEEIAKIIEENF